MRLPELLNKKYTAEVVTGDNVINYIQYNTPHENEYFEIDDIQKIHPTDLALCDSYISKHYKKFKGAWIAHSVLIWNDEKQDYLQHPENEFPIEFYDNRYMIFNNTNLKTNRIDSFPQYYFKYCSYYNQMVVTTHKDLVLKGGWDKHADIHAWIIVNYPNQYAEVEINSTIENPYVVSAYMKNVDTAYIRHYHPTLLPGTNPDLWPDIKPPPSPTLQEKIENAFNKLLIELHTDEDKLNALMKELLKTRQILHDNYITKEDLTDIDTNLNPCILGTTIVKYQSPSEYIQSCAVSKGHNTFDTTIVPLLVTKPLRRSRSLRRRITIPKQKKGKRIRQRDILGRISTRVPEKQSAQKISEQSEEEFSDWINYENV